MITSSPEAAAMTVTRADHADEGIDGLGRAYDEHAAGLFRYARTLLGSAEDAEDAVQEVFVRLARDARRLSRIGNLRHYLLRAARNAAYGILRARTRRERLEQDAALDSIPCRPGIPEGRDESIMAAFAGLPPEQREVLALKVFQGMTFREIASVVGKSQNTVSSRYRYAIERLRAAVGEE